MAGGEKAYVFPPTNYQAFIIKMDIYILYIYILYIYIVYIYIIHAGNNTSANLTPTPEESRHFSWPVMFDYLKLYLFNSHDILFFPARQWIMVSSCIETMAIFPMAGGTWRGRFASSN